MPREAAWCGLRNQRRRNHGNIGIHTQPILFSTGEVLSTPGALDALAKEKISSLTLLARHVTGDWGDVDAHDKLENDHSVKNGNRILSAYKLPLTGGKVWIITEADRSVTTFLLPDEY